MAERLKAEAFQTRCLPRRGFEFRSHPSHTFQRQKGGDTLNIELYDMKKHLRLILGKLFKGNRKEFRYWLECKALPNIYPGTKTMAVYLFHSKGGTPKPPKTFCGECALHIGRRKHQESEFVDVRPASEWDFDLFCDECEGVLVQPADKDIAVSHVL